MQLYVVGYGSSELPIMDKIQQIYGGFENMEGYISNLKFKFNVEQLNTQISQYARQIYEISQEMSPFGWRGESYRDYKTSLIAPRYQQAVQERSTLLEAQQYYQAGGGLSAGGSAQAGISININTIDVSAESSAELAENLDGALADLWRENRSKLRRVIEQ